MRVSLLAVLLAISIALYYWAFRYGFDDNSFSDVLKVLALSFTLILAPDFWYALKNSEGRAEKWFNSAPWYLFSSLMGATALGAASLYLGLPLAWVVLLSGSLLTAWFLVWLFKRKAGISLPLSLLFAAFAIFIPFFFYKTIAHDPLYLEKLILGPGHFDPIYLAAISNMIKTYSYPTIGIDGLTYLPYHYGSHWVFALLSDLVDIPSTKFYNMAYPVIFIPFLFKSFFSFYESIAGHFKAKQRFIVAPFAILFVALAGLYQGIERNQSPLMTTIIFQSESYNLGLALTFILLGIALRFFGQGNATGSASVLDKLFAYGFIPLMVAFISITKISSGFLAMAMFGYVVLRQAWFRKLPVMVSFALSFASFAVAFLIASSMGNGGDKPIELFSFFKNNVGNTIHFLFYYYLYTSLFVFMFLFQNPALGSAGEFWGGLRKNAFLEVELLLFVSIIGLVPGIVMDTTGRNSLYFMDLQRWLSLLMIMAYLPLFAEKVRSFRKFALATRALLAGMALFITFQILENVPRNYYLLVKQAVIDNIYTRNQLLDSADLGQEPLAIETILTGFHQKMHSSQIAKESLPRHRLFRELIELGNRPIAEKKQTCVYIPKTNDAYWKIPLYKRLAIPFIAPALSGIAMIEGVPAYFPHDFVGFASDYTYKDASRTFTDEEIALVAKEQGFQHLIIIENAEQETIVRELDL